MLSNLQFENRFVDGLPGDPEPRNYVRNVVDACYSIVEPRTVSRPTLVAYSRQLAEVLGFSPEDCESSTFTEVFSGNKRLDGMTPFAMCYGGHQFGNWAGQLGDGRAITLGEIVGSNGQHYSLQLKGAGLTPYSRTADGLAVLRSSLREFICSEAMHHLGIPTTRALSLVLTGDTVIRDILYDGHPAPELGAIVCRVAPTFVRFGNFEIFAAQRNFEVMKQLIDHTVKFDFPELRSLNQTDTYVRWFESIVDRTAYLMAEWTRVGFVHGVMNTDNMSITGLTIDYGPYGWLESYDPNWTPNTTDAGTRRYRFGQQPAVAQWNLLQLANAIAPVVGEVKPLESALNQYSSLFDNYYLDATARKLGLRQLTQADSELLREMNKILTCTETDMTIFFRNLASVDVDGTANGSGALGPIQDAFYAPKEVEGDVAARISNWLCEYSKRVRVDSAGSEWRINRMHQANPLYVPRNYLAQLAIDAAEKGDYSFLHEWLDILQNPYTYQHGKDLFKEKRPEWARTRVGCSMLSCSS